MKKNLFLTLFTTVLAISIGFSQFEVGSKSSNLGFGGYLDYSSTGNLTSTRHQPETLR